MVDNPAFIADQKEGKKGIIGGYKISDLINCTDSSTVLIAEESYFYGTASTVGKHDHREFNLVCANIMIVHQKNNKVNWVRIIPKFQEEGIGHWSSMLYPKSLSSEIRFARSGGMPYFSSFFSTVKGSNLLLIFNDDPKNDDVDKANDKIKKFTYDKRMHTSLVTVDLTTGALNRKKIHETNNGTGMMARFALQQGNYWVIPFLQFHNFSLAEINLSEVRIVD